jgi:hypothetical protein
MPPRLTCRLFRLLTRAQAVTGPEAGLTYDALDASAGPDAPATLDVAASPPDASEAGPVVGVQDASPDGAVLPRDVVDAAPVIRVEDASQANLTYTSIAFEYNSYNQSRDSNYPQGAQVLGMPERILSIVLFSLGSRWGSIEICVSLSAMPTSPHDTVVTLLFSAFRGPLARHRDLCQLQWLRCYSVALAHVKRR